MEGEAGGDQRPWYWLQVLGFPSGKPLTVSWLRESQPFTFGQPGPSIGKDLSALRRHVSSGES